MINAKEVLVVTTSTIEGMNVLKYLNPVTSHVVAGTNVFSDFFAGLTDVFGGRSKSYQNQISSLYNEAIDQIKLSAFKLGANCVLGLKIDIDEISGKSKSMFMLTAVGTAVIIENEYLIKDRQPQIDDKRDIVGIEVINTLKKKKEIINDAKLDRLVLSEVIWDFIISNNIVELFPFLIKEYSKIVKFEQLNPGNYYEFYNHLVMFLENLPEELKLDLLYSAIPNSEQSVAYKFSEIINDLKLFDYLHTLKILQNSNFQTKKHGVRIACANKPVYTKRDIDDLNRLISIIEETFLERGTRSFRKQILSSKEKEFWKCECGNSNELGNYCSNCNNDIFGFLPSEIKPIDAVREIKMKIELITESLS